MAEILTFSQITRVKSTLFHRKRNIISKITVLVIKSKVVKQRLFRSFFSTKHNGRFYKKNQSVVDYVKKSQSKTDNIPQKKTLNRLKLEKQFEK